MKMSRLTVCLLALFVKTVISLPCPCEDPSLCNPIKSIPQKEIFIFSVTNSSDVWMKYDWAHISTVVTVGYDSSELMCYAHKRNIRVIKLVDFASAEDLTNTTYRLFWIKEQVKLVQDHFLDGVNVDFESEIPKDREDLRRDYTMLVSDTSKALKTLNPSAQVSVDVPWSPNGIYLRYYDYVGLAQASDFLLVMDYDERDVPFAAANSNFYNAALGMERYMQLMPSSKLVLGVPWYGYDFTCVKLYLNNSCPLGSIPRRTSGRMDLGRRGMRDTYLGGASLGYHDALMLLKNSTTGRLWDPKSLSPYFNYKDSSGKYHQVWYDDPDSCGMKYSLVKLYNLRGASMWQADALDYTDSAEGAREREQMWGAIAVVRP